MKSNRDRIKNAVIVITKLLFRLFLIYAMLIFMFSAFVAEPNETLYTRAGNLYRLDFCLWAFETGFILNAVISLLYAKKHRLFWLVHTLLATGCLMRLAWLLTL